MISQEVCREWDWKQPNGVLKDMVCRSLLLFLESKGFIKLPTRKFTPANPLAKRKKPSRVIVDKTPVHCSVGELFPIKLELVRRTRFEKIFNGLVKDCCIEMVDSKKPDYIYETRAVHVHWDNGKE